MGTSFVTLIRAVLEEMSDDPHAVTGVTTAAGDADSLIDTTNLQVTSAKASAALFVGEWVRLIIATVENIRKIKTYVPADGELVPEASFSGAPGASNTWERHKKLEPSRLKKCITAALAEIRYQEILPLTLVEDGDMEDTGTVTDKWGNDANGTPLKDTTYVLFGRQSLKVTAGAADGYTYPTTNVKVTPGNSLLVWAPVYGDEKQAELILYDVTNSAEIKTARHDEKGFGLLFFQATVPADCYEIRPHLRTKTNGGDTYWDHVGILNCDQKVYDAPWWLTKQPAFSKVVSLPYGGSLTSDNALNAYALWREGPEHEHTASIIATHRGVVPLRLELYARPSEPLFVIGKRKGYPALSADDDETEADEATVKAGALAFAFRRLGDDYADHAAYWADMFNDLRFGEEPPKTVRQVSCWRNR